MTDIGGSYNVSHSTISRLWDILPCGLWGTIMSEPIEKTAAGATRTLFGTLGFILIMLGIESMTGAAGIPVGLGLFLALLGVLCVYAAFFWETAKKVLRRRSSRGYW